VQSGARLKWSKVCNRNAQWSKSARWWGELSSTIGFTGVVKQTVRERERERERDLLYDAAAGRTKRNVPCSLKHRSEGGDGGMPVVINVGKDVRTEVGNNGEGTSGSAVGTTVGNAVRSNVADTFGKAVGAMSEALTAKLSKHCSRQCREQSCWTNCWH
jgi:hypothetical protein